MRYLPILAALLLVACGEGKKLMPPNPQASNPVEAEYMCDDALAGRYSNVAPGDQINIRIGDNPFGLVCVIPSSGF